jgi:hypothetical protein
LFQTRQQQGYDMLAVVAHGATAVAVEPDAMASRRKVDRLLVDVSAAAVDFTPDQVAVPADFDDVALPGITVATRKGSRIELTDDVLETEIHGRDRQGMLA